MRRRLRQGSAVVLLLAVGIADAAPVPVLAYHDIVAHPDGDAYAITADDFFRQLDYLRQAGYHPVSLHDLEQAHAGAAPLPAKPVLLTFDDGYKSYYDIALPALRARGFPSVVSIVTSWIDRRSAPDYTAAAFMSWDELRVVAKTHGVELLSHSDDLHHDIATDAYGTRRPAAIARAYDPTTGTYETEEAHIERVRADLARSVQRMREELGVTPRGITWPYGSYDGAALRAGAALGLREYLTLDEQPTDTASLPRINRSTFRDYRGLRDFGAALTFRSFRRRQLRFVGFDLATLAVDDAAQRTQRIRALERRAELLRVNTVVLRPFSDDGKRAYFHTAAMPVAADVLGQITYLLKERVGLRELLLRIPAGVTDAACADLARFNWFTGIVVDGSVGAAEVDRLAGLFRGFNPGLKIGVTAEPAAPAAKVDFTVVRFAAETAPSALAVRTRGALTHAVAPLFLLDRTTDRSLDALRTAMAVLRSVGAADYGYGPDDYLNDRPAFLHIVRPLAEFTATDK